MYKYGRGDFAMKRRAYSFIAITLAILILSGMNFVYASRKVPIKSLSMVVNKASVLHTFT